LGRYIKQNKKKTKTSDEGEKKRKTREEEEDEENEEETRKAFYFRFGRTTGPPSVSGASRQRKSLAVTQGADRSYKE